MTLAGEASIEAVFGAQPSETIWRVLASESSLWVGGKRTRRIRPAIPARRASWFVKFYIKHSWYWLTRPPAMEVHDVTHQRSFREVTQLVHRVQVHGDERSLLSGDRSTTRCLAGRNSDAFHGFSFCWTRGSSIPCDWPDGWRHRLALCIRRSFGGTASCGRVGDRPTDLRTCGPCAFGDKPGYSPISWWPSPFSILHSPLVAGCFSVAKREAATRLSRFSPTNVWTEGVSEERPVL